MKLLGIDYGKSKIGLASSEGVLAEPLAIISAKSALDQIGTICVQKGIEKIIVGISEEKMAEETINFVNKLKTKVSVPVEFQDETLTSKDAIAKMKQVGKRLKREDAISAALILQSYLDSVYV